MSVLLLGLAAALPCALALGLRYLSLRLALDKRARAAYLAKALAFLGSSAVATALLCSFRGGLALPALWQLAVALLAFGLSLALIRRG